MDSIIISDSEGNSQSQSQDPPMSSNQPNTIYISSDEEETSQSLSQVPMTKAIMEDYETFIDTKRQKEEMIKKEEAKLIQQAQHFTDFYTMDRINKWIEDNKETLAKIENGEIENRRHRQFQETSDKQKLHCNVIASPLFEKVSDMISKSLRRMFPVIEEGSDEDIFGTTINIPKSNYQFFVTGPTILIKLYGEQFQVTDEEAETIINNTPFPDSQ